MEDPKIAPLKAPSSWYGAVRARVRLVYAVIAIVFLALLAWAYGDKYAREHDDQMARLNVEIQQLADQQSGPFADSMEEMGSEAAGEMTTYAAALNGERFQLDLPPGYRLSPGTGDFKSEYMYVMAESTAEGELPVMTINQTSAASVGAAGPVDGGYVVKGSGDTAYWLTLWEDMEWEPFDRVAASFKAL